MAPEVEETVFFINSTLRRFLYETEINHKKELCTKNSGLLEQPTGNFLAPFHILFISEDCNPNNDKKIIVEKMNLNN